MSTPFSQKDRDAFALKVQAYLKKALAGEAFIYDGDTFSLVSADPGRPTLRLAPSFEFYTGAPIWQRSSVLAKRLDGFCQMLNVKWPTASKVRSKLRPKIRNRSDI